MNLEARLAVSPYRHPDTKRITELLPSDQFTMTEEGFFCLPDIPDSCPFTISRLLTPSGEASASWLIREHDQCGEYPHIYAKVCTSPRRQEDDDGGPEKPAAHKVIVLSDTGCATETLNTKLQRCDADGLNEIYSTPPGEPRRWNLRTFLEYTINPGGQTPYVVITTHCHYDHILGIGKLMKPTPPARPRCFSPKTRHMSHEQLSRVTTPTVLTSSHDKSFVTPYANLQRHSLSSSVGLYAPRYAITWAEDLSEVQWHFSDTSKDSDSVAPVSSISTSISISSRITVLHTPGHTPDSMSWYDADLALVCVGDSFYVKETDETRKALWGPEPPMPTMFDVESDLADLWRSMQRLLDFARARNEELERECEPEPERNVIERLSDHGMLLRQPNAKRDRAWPWRSAPCQSQTGFDYPHPQSDGQGRLPKALFLHARNTATEHDLDDDDWILVDLVVQGTSSRSASSPPPRVRLAAAHTTVTLDAEAAILSFREFIARILRDEVPKQRAKEGYRGEERWFFDFALQEGGEPEHDIQNGNLRYLHSYSVLAPLQVIELGRRKIPREAWMKLEV